MHMTPDHTARSMATTAAKKLEKYALDGKLPAVYNGNIYDLLADFYPDLPWDPEGGQSANDFLCDDPECQRIAKLFQETFQFDLAEEWRRARDGRED